MLKCNLSPVVTASSEEEHFETRWGNGMASHKTIKSRVTKSPVVYSQYKQQKMSPDFGAELCWWLWGTEVQFDTVQPEWPGIARSVDKMGPL